jgi:hypothetical protein
MLPSWFLAGPSSVWSAERQALGPLVPYCTPDFSPRCKIATHWQESILSLVFSDWFLWCYWNNSCTDILHLHECLPEQCTRKVDVFCKIETVSPFFPRKYFALYFFSRRWLLQINFYLKE